MNNISTSSIEQASKILIQGEIIAFPTETVYGLGALISCQKALKKIFESKGRPIDNPLIVHVSKKDQFTDLSLDIPQPAKILIEKLCPGPLTLVLRRNPARINDIISAGLETVAIRMPAHTLALELIDRCDEAIAAASANISGRPSSTHKEHILQDFSGELLHVLMGEDDELGLESTVLDCSSYKTDTPNLTLLRAGSLEVEAIESCLKAHDIVYNLVLATGKAEIAMCPGMKYRHYAPVATVVLFSSEIELRARLEQFKDKKVFFLGTSQFIKGEISNERCIYDQGCIYSSLSEYARELFAEFRECEKKGVEVILCELPPSVGIGRAIRDRLLKAASHIEHCN